VFVQPARCAPHVDGLAHSSTSVHEPPEAGAVYPDGHVHAYEPAVLAQVPTPQAEPVAHSFTSTQVALSPLPES
jgi:hypothetical protein